MDEIPVNVSLEFPVQYCKNTENIYHTTTKPLHFKIKQIPRKKYPRNTPKTISCPDSNDETIIYFVRNDEQHCIITKYQKRIQQWSEIVKIQSSCFILKCFKDMLIAAFDDKTVAFIDTETGFPAAPLVYVEDWILKIECCNDDIFVIISERLEIFAWKNIYRKNQKLLFNQRINFKISTNFSIKTTYCLENCNITFVINDLELQRNYYFSYECNAWIECFANIPQFLSGETEPETLYQIENRMFNRIIDSNPKFLYDLLTVLDIYCRKKNKSEIMKKIIEIIDISKDTEVYSSVYVVDMFRDVMSLIKIKLPDVIDLVIDYVNFKHSRNEGADIPQHIMKIIHDIKENNATENNLDSNPYNWMLDNALNQSSASSNSRKTNIMHDSLLLTPPNFNPEIDDPTSPIPYSYRASLSIDRIETQTETTESEIDTKMTSSSTISPYKSSTTDSISYSTPTKSDSLHTSGVSSNEDQVETPSNYEMKIFSSIRDRMNQPALRLLPQHSSFSPRVTNEHIQRPTLEEEILRYLSSTTTTSTTDTEHDVLSIESELEEISRKNRN